MQSPAHDGLHVLLDCLQVVYLAEAGGERIELPLGPSGSLVPFQRPENVTTSLANEFGVNKRVNPVCVSFRDLESTSSPMDRGLLASSRNPCLGREKRNAFWLACWGWHAYLPICRYGGNPEPDPKRPRGHSGTLWETSLSGLESEQGR